MRTALSIAACAALVFVVAGCGQSGVKPEGKILKKGEPFTPEGDEFVQVTFMSASDAGGSYLASFNPDHSTFTVVDEKPMPPGKYKVCVQLMKKHKDSLKGKFGPASTPFVFDIQTGKEEINVDIDQAVSESKQKSSPPPQRLRRERERR